MQFRWLLSVLVALVFVAAGCLESDTKVQYGPVTYVAVGASDTVGVGTTDPVNQSWVAILNRRLPEGGKFVQLGVSGTTAERALVEQVPKAVDSNPDLITVWLAVNDLHRFIPAENFGTTLEAILIKLRSTNARVFVGNLPDLSQLPLYSGIPKVLMNQRVREYNEEIDNRASDAGAVVVDLFPLYELQSEKSTKSLVSSDGFHPSEEGYKVIADAFWLAIQRDSVIGPRVSR